MGYKDHLAATIISDKEYYRKHYKLQEINYIAKRKKRASALEDRQIKLNWRMWGSKKEYN